MLGNRAVCSVHCRTPRVRAQTRTFRSRYEALKKHTKFDGSSVAPELQKEDLSAAFKSASLIHERICSAGALHTQSEAYCAVELFNADFQESLPSNRARTESLSHTHAFPPRFRPGMDSGRFRTAGMADIKTVPQSGMEWDSNPFAMEWTPGSCCDSLRSGLDQ